MSVEFLVRFSVFTILVKALRCPDRVALSFVDIFPLVTAPSYRKGDKSYTLNNYIVNYLVR